jgi:hypothetical protein
MKDGRERDNKTRRKKRTMMNRKRRLLPDVVRRKELYQIMRTYTRYV